MKVLTKKLLFTLITIFFSYPVFSYECNKLNSIVDYFNVYNQLDSSQKLIIINQNGKWNLSYDSYYSEILEKLIIDVPNGYILLSFHYGDGIKDLEFTLFKKNDKSGILCIREYGGLYGSDSIKFYKCNNLKLVLIDNVLQNVNPFSSLDESFFKKNKNRIEELHKQKSVLTQFYKIPRYGTKINLKFVLSFQAYSGNNFNDEEKLLINDIKKHIKYSFDYIWNESTGTFSIEKINL